jgi:hypothetical protein
MGVQWRAISKDGRLTRVPSRGTPILDSAGSVHRDYGSTEDVDELVKLREYRGQARTTRPLYSMSQSRLSRETVSAEDRVHA